MMTEAEARYRAGAKEKARTADLLRVLPRGRKTVLDIGARDGHFSRLLTEYFTEVIALDLKKPSFDIPGVVNVAGDVTALEFADNSFDCVFCAEVLEHVPALERACSEIARVARHEIVIGVPYRQNTKMGQSTCITCGKINPAWGHVNTFDDKRLRQLFPGLREVSKSFVGTSRGATNPLAVWLMTLGGNPWGAYGQDEPCIHCGARLIAPQNRSIARRICSAAAYRLQALQTRFARPHGNWIHLVLSKD